MTERTDTWLSNEAEGFINADPWDPDTDDDGLTDGQELKWITRSRIGQVSINALEKDITPNTNPLLPDTDGDDYWDGWIGVHGIDPQRSDKVIKYMENLNQGGIQQSFGPDGNEEVVSEQLELYDEDGDGVKDHSKVHIGELYWKANDPSVNGDPDSNSITPNPHLDIEVDYYSGIDKDILDRLDIASENYGIYDMDVKYHINESLDSDDLNFGLLPGDDQLPPTSRQDAENIQSRYQDHLSYAYMFITTENDGVFFGNTPVELGGVASSRGGNEVDFADYGVVIFTRDFAEARGISQSNKDYQHVLLHEVGHLLGAGRADDIIARRPEVYSGEDDNGVLRDATPEEVGLRNRRPNRLDEWSVMAEGGRAEFVQNRYVPFSIEELSTIEFNNVDSIQDNG